jgi:hypothetical protein
MFILSDSPETTGDSAGRKKKKQAFFPRRVQLKVEEARVGCALLIP